VRQDLQDEWDFEWWIAAQPLWRVAEESRKYEGRRMKEEKFWILDFE